MPSQFDVKVEVHMPLRKGYRVKILCRSIGIYINGAVVFPPDAKSDKWEFRSPAQMFNHKWVSLVEFDTKLPLWREVIEESFRAVREYIEFQDEASYYNQPPSRDVIPVDIDDEPLDWNAVDIPF